MTNDDRLVFAPGDNGVDQPELPDGPGERLELIVADANGIGGSGRRSPKGRSMISSFVVSGMGTSLMVNLTNDCGFTGAIPPLRR